MWDEAGDNPVSPSPSHLAQLELASAVFVERLEKYFNLPVRYPRRRKSQLPADGFGELLLVNEAILIQIKCTECRLYWLEPHNFLIYLVGGA